MRAGERVLPYVNEQVVLATRVERVGGNRGASSLETDEKIYVGGFRAVSHTPRGRARATTRRAALLHLRSDGGYFSGTALPGMGADGSGVLLWIPMVRATHGSFSSTHVQPE